MADSEGRSWEVSSHPSQQEEIEEEHVDSNALRLLRCNSAIEIPVSQQLPGLWDYITSPLATEFTVSNFTQFECEVRMVDVDSCTVLAPNRKDKTIQYHGDPPKITIFVNLAPLGHDHFFELPNFRNFCVTRLCSLNIKPNHINQCFRRNKLTVCTKEGENALKSAGSFSPKRKSNGSPSPKAAPQLIDGACVCGRIKFTMPDHPKPYAIYKCHCNKCRQLGSRNGGITWVGFESQQVKFANWHVDLLKIHGKRAACPDCSCSIYMAYADDYVYIDERRLVDGARYTRPSYLSTLHRKYQRRKHGICVGHIYTKSEGLPPDYGFDPPDIPKFDQDANWIQSMV